MFGSTNASLLFVSTDDGDWCTYNGGLLPDILLLALYDYHHRGAKLSKEVVEFLSY